MKKAKVINDGDKIVSRAEWEELRSKGLAFRGARGIYFVVDAEGNRFKCSSTRWGAVRNALKGIRP